MGSRMRKMLQAMYFDWGGSQDELKAFEKSWKAGCDDCEGIDYMALYAPNNQKWHYAMFWETDNYHRWQEAAEIAQKKYGGEGRDYNKMTHAVFEIWIPYEYPK